MWGRGEAGTERQGREDRKFGKEKGKKEDAGKKEREGLARKNRKGYLGRASPFPLDLPCPDFASHLREKEMIAKEVK
jgi:hypothetical protein